MDMVTSKFTLLYVVFVMVVAEISENVCGLWNGQLRDSDSGDPIGPPWHAESRSALIAEMRRWVPLSHLSFQDRMNPLDP